jgi:hypothetical protein
MYRHNFRIETGQYKGLNLLIGVTGKEADQAVKIAVVSD